MRCREVDFRQHPVLAESVSTRRCQEADFRSDGPASQSRLAANPGETRYRPGAGGPDCPVRAHENQATNVAIAKTLASCLSPVFKQKFTLGLHLSTARPSSPPARYPSDGWSGRPPANAGGSTRVACLQPAPASSIRLQPVRSGEDLRGCRCQRHSSAARLSGRCSSTRRVVTSRPWRAT